MSHDHHMTSHDHLSVGVLRGIQERHIQIVDHMRGYDECLGKRGEPLNLDKLTRWVGQEGVACSPGVGI